MTTLLSWALCMAMVFDDVHHPVKTALSFVLWVLLMTESSGLNKVKVIVTRD